MFELRQRKAILLVAGAVFVCSVGVVIGLARSASDDLRPAPWGNRVPGFVVVGIALAIGCAAFARGKRQDTSYWVMTGLLTMSALLTSSYWHEAPAPPAGGQARTIPRELGGGEWTMIEDRDHEPDERTVQILGTNDIVMRNYRRRNSSDKVELAVIFGNKRTSVHPPEKCYGSQGREFHEIAADSFVTEDGRTIPGTRLVFTGGGPGQAVFFWYRAGSYNAANILRQHINAVWCSLMGRNTRIGLIRLATNIRDDLSDTPQAMARLKDFARAVFPEIELKVP